MLAFLLVAERDPLKARAQMNSWKSVLGNFVRGSPDLSYKQSMGSYIQLLIPNPLGVL